MSQRSVLEINHDYSHNIKAGQDQFVELLLRALASGSDENWAPLRAYGVHRVAQCHHSEYRKLVVGGNVADREYPFG